MYNLDAFMRDSLLSCLSMNNHAISKDNDTKNAGEAKKPDRFAAPGGEIAAASAPRDFLRTF
jgi:hypothetical protein